MFKIAMIANDDHRIPDWVYEVEEADIEFVCHDCRSREFENCAADADVWLQSEEAAVTEENMDILKKVGAVIKCGSGTNNIDHAACTKRGIIVSHTPNDPTEPTSDHAIAMLFTAAIRTAAQDHMIRSGVWNARACLPIGQFAGANLGVIGFGRIGRAIIGKLSGFKMNVRVYDPFVDAAGIEQSGAKKTEIEELLRESQYVLVCCPLMDETRGLLGEKELGMMRRDSILVNCARGGIVDEAALKKALKEGRIGAAALDSMEEHPEPGDEWFGFDNVNFTPHLGGYGARYSDDQFESPVHVMIEMSKMRLPKWIANKGVVPKWNMTTS